MEIARKLKYCRKIKISYLFFTKNEISWNKKKFKQSKDFFLLLNELNFDFTSYFSSTYTCLFEIELIILPALKPMVGINFKEKLFEESFKPNENLKILFSKKSTIFCSNLLPMFKCKQSLQGDIIKFEFIIKELRDDDKIFLMELIKEKYHKNSKTFLSKDCNYWTKKLGKTFMSNGFLEFKEFKFHNHFLFLLQGYLKNKGLLRFNLGPEFRFNFRY
jgi:hypothetical protein